MTVYGIQQENTKELKALQSPRCQHLIPFREMVGKAQLKIDCVTRDADNAAGFCIATNDPRKPPKTSWRHVTEGVSCPATRENQQKRPRKPTRLRHRPMSNTDRDECVVEAWEESSMNVADMTRNVEVEKLQAAYRVARNMCRLSLSLLLLLLLLFKCVAATIRMDDDITLPKDMQDWRD